MKRKVWTCAWAIAAIVMFAAAAGATDEGADASDVAELEQKIDTMQRDYDARVRALEERVEAAEQKAEQKAARDDEGAGEEEAGPGVIDRAEAAWDGFSKTFNPDLSAILQGRVAYLQGGGGAFTIPDFPIGAQTDRGNEGISLGESELVLSSNVDDRFFGYFDVTFDQDEIGIEEAYFQTLALPFGFGFKGGQFLSAIGYHNDRHSHVWDFVDGPLVYDAMLDGAYSDPGMQLTWVAPIDLYLELGGEVFRGDAFPAAGAAYHGFGTVSAFAKVSGDIGDGGTWKLGASWLRSESDARAFDLSNGDTSTFDGTTNLAIADFVYKWAPFGNFRQRNFTLQGEYMHRWDDGTLAWTAGGGPYRSNQDGFYVQGVYQFIPRWRVGVRYGQLWGDSDFNGPPPPDPTLWGGQSPRRTSAMIDFSNSEFSRFRLQYSYATGGLGNDSLVYLQYIISIGSHGAHTF